MEAARLVRSSLLVPFGSAWSHNGSTTSQKSPSGESGDHRGRRIVLCMSAAVHADGLSQKAALLHVQGRMTWNANMLRSEQMLQRKSCRRGADLDATGRSCLSPNRARAGGVHEMFVAFAARQFDLPGKEARESRDPYLVISSKSSLTSHGVRLPRCLYRCDQICAGGIFVVPHLFLW